MSLPVVVVIDDDRSLLHTIHRVLVRSEFQTFIYDNPKAFVDDCREDPFYLEEVSAFLVDTFMPEVGGYEIQKLIKDQGCQIPFILMSGEEQRAEMINEAWRKGAFDFLLKPFSMDILLDTLDRAVRERKAQKRPAPSIDHSLAAKLTPREREILQEIASGSSSQETANRLGISERTVKLHRSNLRKRLGIHRIADLVRFHDHIKDAL